MNEKIKSEEELVEIIRQLKAEGKKVGFSSGAFDLVHAGHVLYLKEAKEQCDVLVIALNSDQSVKEYKGENRPIVGQEDRAAILSAFEFVDFILIKEDRRNRRLLEALKPDLYIKGGDYTPEQLTSSDVMDKIGGKTVILPLSKGLSTTELVQRSKRAYGEEKELKQVKRERGKAVFLDRDGTINEEVEFLHEPEKFKLLPNVIEGIKKMMALGYKIVVVTTQTGIGLGYFTKEDFYKVNRVMLKEFSKNGIIVDKIYFCPHNIVEKCNCRKPETGLLERGRDELDVDLKQSFMVGDKTCDLLAGKNAGCQSVLVETGWKGEDKQFEVEADFKAKDLLAAAEIIEKNQA
jgi:rfaE bifunctional protein nucleotidyltransferase chain/domain